MAVGFGWLAGWRDSGQELDDKQELGVDSKWEIESGQGLGNGQELSNGRKVDGWQEVGGGHRVGGDLPPDAESSQRYFDIKQFRTSVHDYIFKIL